MPLTTECMELALLTDAFLQWDVTAGGVVCCRLDYYTFFCHAGDCVITYRHTFCHHLCKPKSVAHPAQSPEEWKAESYIRHTKGVQPVSKAQGGGSVAVRLRTQRWRWNSIRGSLTPQSTTRSLRLMIIIMPSVTRFFPRELCGLYVRRIVKNIASVGILKLVDISASDAF